MRDQWNRDTERAILSNEEAAILLGSYFPNVKVAKVEPTKGGLANASYLVALKTGQRLHLRICQRDPSAAEKEYRLIQLVQGKVPAPKPIYFSAVNPVNNFPFMVLDWVEGTRLESIIGELSPRNVEHLGNSLGATLALIHGFKFEQFGFFDDHLEIPATLEMGGNGLLQYAEECLLENLGQERIGEALTNEVLSFIRTEARLLDDWSGRPCLTHCDFNGSNILVQKEEQGWEVTAVIDWEFAISGTPFFDLGNLLRPPLGEIPGMESAVERGYRNAGGELPNEWRKMSKLTDLTAWLEFLTRKNAGVNLISDCKRQICKTMSEWV